MELIFKLICSVKINTSHIQFFTKLEKKLLEITHETQTLNLVLLASANTFSQTPLWMRYPAISPDGSTIAFNYKGDIY